MRVLHTKRDLRELLTHGEIQRPIGLVPTMGNLHNGHLDLIDQSQRTATTTIATIFVNPLQFGPNEDYASYPRMLDTDAALLEQRKVDVLFAPTMTQMYPSGQIDHTLVSVPELSTLLCGANRPGHFDGVTTVVSKLFHITQPDCALFGEKDWQQLTIIKRMVKQLDIPLKIIGVPTRREADGLAMSSRNRYLNTEQRRLAPQLYKILLETAAALPLTHDYSHLETAAFEQLKTSGFHPDYVAIRDSESLSEPTTETSQLRVLAAARLGKARLIDNVAAAL